MTTDCTFPTRCQRLLALAVAFSIALLADPIHAAEIRLRDNVSTGSTIVRLRDVAEIAGADDREAAELGEVTLSPGPAGGSEIRIDVATIRSRLAARGVNLARTTLSGSSVVVVRNGTPAVSQRPPQKPDERLLLSQQKRAEKLLEEAIRNHLVRSGASLGQVTISVHVEQEDVSKVLQGASAGFQITGGKPPFHKPQTMLIRTLDKQNIVQEFPIQCRIASLPAVFAARRTISKGQVVRPEDIVQRQVETVDGAFDQARDLIGQEAQRTIRQDEVIRQEDVRSVPLIRSNDIVTVFSRRGGIVVKSAMKARSDGSAGETVTLVTLDGRQTLVAVVTGYHEAEVGAERSGADEPRVAARSIETRSTSPGAFRSAELETVRVVSGESGDRSRHRVQPLGSAPVEPDEFPPAAGESTIRSTRPGPARR